MSYKLSICIPTYNRARFLTELLDSIIGEITDDMKGLIEISISDNASNDNTEKIVLEYKKKFNDILYFKWHKNMGADRNYLKVVEISRGEYCWLMGSDDRIEKGSIKYVIDKLNQNKNLSGMSLNRLSYDYHFSKTLKERPVTDGKISSDTLFNNINDIAYYFGDYFGYISGQVINKKLWDEVVNENEIENYLNAYVHVFVILNMIKKNPMWYYIHKPCIGCRSGNDSFLSDGRFNRIKIDIYGYEKIWGDVLGRNNKTYHKLIEKVSTFQIFNGILTGKMEGRLKGDYFKLVFICLKYYYRYPKFWIKTFVLLITPTFILKILRFLYRKTLKKVIVKS